MNLIEQLGGYEKANSKLLKMDKILKEVYFSYSDAKKADDLRSALLEHRRANNIFEVGDWVIPIKQPESEFMHAIQIERIGVYGGFYDTKWRLLSISKFRHATQQEIKAGHRL